MSGTTPERLPQPFNLKNRSSNNVWKERARLQPVGSQNQPKTLRDIKFRITEVQRDIRIKETERNAEYSRGDQEGKMDSRKIADLDQELTELEREFRQLQNAEWKILNPEPEENPEKPTEFRALENLEKLWDEFVEAVRTDPQLATVTSLGLVGLTATFGYLVLRRRRASV